MQPWCREVQGRLGELEDALQGSRRGSAEERAIHGVRRLLHHFGSFVWGGFQGALGVRVFLECFLGVLGGWRGCIAGQPSRVCCGARPSIFAPYKGSDLETVPP